jgi:hypothetical protein
MGRHGARTWTFGDDTLNSAMLDGLEDLPGINDDHIVGRITELTGRSQGASYSLEFIMYNEIAGARPEARIPMIDMRVYATVGDVLWPDTDAAILQDPQYGALRGLIWLYSDRTTAVDFGHGTTASSNPETQKFFEKLIGYYGISPEDLFGADAHLGFRYDANRFKRLVSGLHKLATANL